MNKAKIFILVSIAACLFQCGCGRRSASSLADGGAAVPPSTTCHAQTSTLDDQLYLCDATSNVSDSQVKICLQKVYPLYKGLDEGCRNKFRGQVQSAFQNLLTWQLNGLSFDQAQNFDDTRLKAFFRNFNTWYTDLAPILYRDFYDRRTLEPRLSDEFTFKEASEKLSAGLWKKINSTAAIDNINEPLRSKSFEQIGQVLAAAFAADENARKAPPEFILQLFVDAVMPLNERLALLVDLHDLACQLGGCGSASASAVSQLVALNAGLVDTNFTQVISSATLVPSSVRDIFKTINNNRDYLLQAVSAAPRADQEPRLGGLGPNFRDVIGSLPVEGLPSHLRNFVAFVQKYKALQQNAAATGMFSGRDSNTLEMGLSSDALTSVKNRNQVLVNRLQSKMDTFVSERTALINAMRQKVEADLNSATNSYSLRSVNLRLQNLVNDLNGVRAAIEKNKGDFAAYMAQVETAQNNGALKLFERRAAPGESFVFNATPADAKFSVGSKPDTDVATSSFKKVELSDGDYLRFTVTGEWAPVCALSRSGYAQNLDLSNVAVDSGGFTITSSGGTAHVTSSDSVHRETNYTDVSVSAQACVGGGVGVASASACVSATAGRRVENSKSQSESDSNRFSQDASFYSGMRLENTPYPMYPAGSLLAIVMPKGSHDPLQRQTVTVVSRQSAIFARGDSDVYFVVNDCASAAPATSAVVVTVDRVATVHASAKAMLETILASVKTIEDKAEDIVKTGSVTSRALQNIKAKITADLTVDGTIVPEFYNYPVLRDLFSYWLDSETYQVELKAEARNLEQQMALLALENERFEYTQESLANSSNLVELQMHFARNGADLFLVVEPLSRAVAYMRSRLLPMIKLHYAKILDELPASQVQALLPSIDAPLADVAKHVIETMDAINERLENEYSVISNQSQTQNLLLRFPKPGSMPTSLGIPTADQARSQALWNALTGSSTEASTSIVVDANDVYQPDFSFGRLSCQQVRPVITDMMIGFVLDFSSVADEQLESWNDKQISLNSEFDGQLIFPQASGPDRYRLVNPDAASKSVAVGFVGSNNVSSLQHMLDAKTYAEHAGLGMSPISTLKLANLASVRSLFSTAPGCQNCISPNVVTDIVIAYKVEVATVAESNRIKWLDNCKP